MKVIAFERSATCDGWSEAELNLIADAIGGSRAFETGMTENGDAQLYVLGPLPEQACELCLSRIDGQYILEDETGWLMIEHRSLPLVTQRAARALRTTRWRFVARIVLAWATIRTVIHDRVEPVLAESEDAIVHLLPQLAAFA